MTLYNKTRRQQQKLEKKSAQPTALNFTKFSSELDPVALKVWSLFCSKNISLATAESCTGGEIAVKLTSIPGASKFFVGGIISYSNQVKHDLLKVPQKILNTYGAVSKPTALMMAQKARQVLRADWSVAVTGIAGPTGGTMQKPVGLVFYAVAGSGVAEIEHRIFKGNRKQIQQKAARAALTLLLRVLKKGEPQNGPTNKRKRKSS